jgi:hypothetical protein
LEPGMGTLYWLLCIGILVLVAYLSFFRALASSCISSLKPSRARSLRLFFSIRASRVFGSSVSAIISSASSMFWIVWFMCFWIFLTLSLRLSGFGLIISPSIQAIYQDNDVKKTSCSVILCSFDRDILHFLLDRLTTISYNDANER